MNRFKRQVSPGAAVFLVVVVLVIVQWVWWRGLVYKDPSKNGRLENGGRPGSARPDLILLGHQYVGVDTLAGALDPGDVDGPGYMARFDRPTGIALDRTGVLYICDTGNNRIRTVALNGRVSTLAGSDQGNVDGQVANAKFNAPCGICLAPDGSIYVADTGNSTVRRIKSGAVTTIARLKPNLSATISPLPVAIEYREAPTPHLLVLDASTKSLDQFSVDGAYISGTPQLETAVIRGEAPTGNRAGAAPVIPIVGAEELVDVKRRPAVKHLTGWSSIGSGALATDLGFGAVFYIKGGTAEVIAGIVPAELPVRNWRDGNGENVLFCSVTCIVNDGVKYPYVSDTGNNCIRRLTLPGNTFK